MRGAVILKHNISDKLCIEGVADVAGAFIEIGKECVKNILAK